MIYCDKCSCEIEKTKQNRLSEVERAVKKLKFSDFGRAKRGSIMDLYYANLPYNKKACLYYGENHGETRIMIEGTGHWLASLNFVDETPEQCLKALQKLI